MATIKTDVLQPFQYNGTNYKYDRSKFDKIQFIEQPQQRSVKTKVLISPELNYNPQYNSIHQTIADANLALNIKTNYENIKYIPITSSGYRGYSSLNSRTNGIKQTFSAAAVKVKSENMCAYDKDCQTKNCIYPHSTKSEAVKETFSTPMDQTPKNPFETNDKILRSPDSGSNYTPSPATEKGSNQGRGIFFKQLNKDRQKALVNQKKDSSNFVTPKNKPKRKGTGFLPGGFTIKEEDED
jgi:hypothetical protein